MVCVAPVGTQIVDFIMHRLITFKEILETELLGAVKESKFHKSNKAH